MAREINSRGVKYAGIYVRELPWKLTADVAAQPVRPADRKRAGRKAEGRGGEGMVSRGQRDSISARAFSPSPLPLRPRDIRPYRRTRVGRARRESNATCLPVQSAILENLHPLENSEQPSNKDARSFSALPLTRSETMGKAISRRYSRRLSRSISNGSREMRSRSDRSPESGAGIEIVSGAGSARILATASGSRPLRASFPRRGGSRGGRER